MSIEEDVKDLLKHCEEAKGNSFLLQINGKDSLLVGTSKKPDNPFSAIILKKNKESVAVIGTLDTKEFEFATEEDVRFPLKVTIAVDCRKVNKVKVYIGTGDKNSFKKITSKSKLNEDEMILIFWENIQRACMTFCSYDSLSNEVIREVICAEEEGVRKFMRSITRHYIDLLFTEAIQR